MKRLMLALGIGLLVAAPAVAATPDEQLVGDPAPGAATGFSVDIDGTTVAVGAPGANAAAGALYIYAQNADETWREAASFTGLGTEGARVGNSVDVSYPRAIVGAPGVNQATIVTEVDGFWTISETLEGEAGFGTEVALNGTSVAAVAAIDDDLNGSVTVFENGPEGGWPAVATLSSPAESQFDRFGDALDFDFNTLVVGAPADSFAATGGGSVYIFTLDAGTWTQSAVLYPSSPVAQANFGRSVSMDAGRIAVGSFEGVHIFFRNTDGFWVEETKLVTADVGDLFGYDVSLMGDQLVVGAPTAINGGETYILERQDNGNWLSAGIATADDPLPTPAPFFGASVSATSELLVVGRPGLGTSNSGGADVFALPIVEVEPPPLGPINPAVSLFDPSSGLWAVPASAGSFFYGDPGDIPVLGDWDCDGTETVGMYRPSNGFAYLRNSNDFGVADISFFLGIADDIPLAGDWNDDGCDTLAVFRDGLVLVRNSLTTGFADEVFYYGLATDTPIAGDWDGNGTTDIGAYRPSNGFVYLRNSRTTGVADLEFFFGEADDVVFVGDWDNDGDDNIGVLRPDEETIYLSYENETRIADERFLISDGIGLETVTPIPIA